MSDKTSHEREFVDYAAKFLKLLCVISENHPAWKALRNEEKYHICVAYRNEAHNHTLTLPADTIPCIHEGYYSAIKQLDSFALVYACTSKLDKYKDFWKSTKRQVAGLAKRKAVLTTVLNTA